VVHYYIYFTTVSNCGMTKLTSSHKYFYLTRQWNRADIKKLIFLNCLIKIHMVSKLAARYSIDNT